MVGTLPSGMSYNQSTNTLTLNNCTINPTEKISGAVISYDSYETYGKKLTIDLKGTNTIYAPESIGIEMGTNDPLKITGNGTLNIIHDSRCALPYAGDFTGIKVGARAGENYENPALEESALTIESGNINISADTTYMFYGISREAYDEPGKKDFTILGGKISIDASSLGGSNGCVVAGIDTQGGNLTIKNAKIDIHLDCEKKNSGIFPLATGYKVYGSSDIIYDGGTLTVEKSDIYMYTSGTAGTKGAYAYKLAIDPSEHYYAGKHTLSKKISADDAWSFNQHWDERYRAKYNCLAITQKVLDSTELNMDFEDVSEDAWYYDNIDYVFKHELMTGLNDTTFGPGNALARAQFATILYRMNGKPDVTYVDKFPDVQKGDWYADAVLWANSIKVVTGYTNTGMFGPGDNINREQMAVMMYRYAKYKGYDTSKQADISRFQDASSVSSFSKEAMEWAVGVGVITGKDNGTKLDPQGNASRAECATIIRRFVEKYE